jgi:DNA-binding winged helix-turn-helix (wHTH) protein
MREQSELQDGFYLEDCYVEPHLGRVTAERRSIRLEPKIMDVLVCLAENQGEVVRKEQFFETTWGDVNVTPHVLARAISEIRRTLNDEAQNPRFIQTVPKIGYRLIAPVSRGRAYTPGAGAAPAVRDNPFSQLNFGYILIAAGLVGAVILAFGIFVIFLMTRHGGPH